MSAVLKAQEPSARYFAAMRPGLVEHFDLVASAPGGVARLRELILTLAVRGKLVPQDANDEPASALLERISVQRNLPISARGVRGEKQAPVLEQRQPLFAAPPGWQWTFARDLCLVITDGDHQPPPKTDSGVPFLVIGDVSDGSIDLPNVARFVMHDYFNDLDWGKKPQLGDVLYTTVGSFGIPIPVILQGAFCFQRHIALFRPALPAMQGFLVLALRSRLVFDQADHGATGIAQKTVPLSVLRNLRLPLPPLQEQTRIVSRVEELMRLCDGLEAKGRLEDALHAKLLNTLLGTLTDSASPEELAANWQRIAAHFDLLLDRPAAVDALEQTILKLAVRGLLVHQDANDEPATKLLAKGDVLRKARAGSGEIKRNNSGQSIPTSEVPFGLPAGWAWSLLPDLCAITGGSTPSKAVPSNWDGDIPWVSPKDMKVSVIKDAQDHVSGGALAGSLSLVPPGSLLMVVRGMILAHSFPVAETLVPVTINQDMKALTPLDQDLLPFLMLVCTGMKSEILRLVDRSTHGTCKLESPKIFGLRIPVPPLAEQRRIVARVNELRRLCADLRARLVAQQTTQTHLAESLVESAAAA